MFSLITGMARSKEEVWSSIWVQCSSWIIENDFNDIGRNSAVPCHIEKEILNSLCDELW